MAHELAHVAHRDILISTISATMAGAISMLANFAMFFGGRDSEGRPANPIAGLAVALLAPIAASLIQMAISRAREFEADRGGAEISGDPRALASALQKIHAYAQGMPLVAAERNPETAQMMIMNPLPRRRPASAVLDPPVDRGAGRAAAGDGRAALRALRRARGGSPALKLRRARAAEIAGEAHSLALPCAAFPARPRSSPCRAPSLAAATCSASNRPRRSPPRARPTARRSVGACRHAGRAIEDCFAIYKKADRAAVFAGWRDMNDYMRENKIEPVRAAARRAGQGRERQASLRPALH